MKLPKIILTLIVLATLAFGTKVYLTWRNQPTYPQPAPVEATTAPVPAWTPSDQIINDGHELGISIEGLTKAYAQIGDVSPCESIGLTGGEVIGCTTNDVVVIKAGRPHDQELQILNYEYLHYVWHHLPQDQKNHFTQELTQLYRSNYGLDQEMAGYLKENGGDTNTFYDELHSAVGTYMADDELPSDLLAHYTQVTSNRSALPSYF